MRARRTSCDARTCDVLFASARTRIHHAVDDERFEHFECVERRRGDILEERNSIISSFPFYSVV